MDTADAQQNTATDFRLLRLQGGGGRGRGGGSCYFEVWFCSVHTQREVYFGCWIQSVRRSSSWLTHVATVSRAWLLRGGTGVGHLLEGPRTIFLGAMFYCPHAVGRSFWSLSWGSPPALNKVSSWAEAPVIVSSVDRFVCVCVCILGCWIPRDRRS